MIAEADDTAILGVLAVFGTAAAASSGGLGQDGDVARTLHPFRGHADRLGSRATRPGCRTCAAVLAILARLT